jgi:hypothetical protein
MIQAAVPISMIALGRTIMKKLSWIAPIIILVFSACAPSASAIQTAIAQTQAAAPTNLPPTILPATLAPTVTATPTVTSTPLTGKLLPVRGLYVQFERRGDSSRYWSGEALDTFNDYDDLVGHTVSQEIALQLDEIAKLGVNTITFELRAADPTYVDGPYAPPVCNIGPALGPQYPQPSAKEIQNLIAFLDLVSSKGLKVELRLVNTHQEEQPPMNNALWLGTILKAIKDHPALDLVLFEGDAHLLDLNGDGIPDSCGVPAEPSLWLGPTNVAAQYVKWAIEYAHSLGIPYRKLSAEAIVGDYYAMNHGPAGPSATGSHQWAPIEVLKDIFDSLSVPTDQRTYAISFYEHKKCLTARQLPCVEVGPHAWAVETVKDMFDVIGRQNGARVVAPEMGAMVPVDPAWNTGMALESLAWIMQTYGIDGGSFWRWTSFFNYEDADPANATTIKLRGKAYTYTPVKDVLQALYTRGQTQPVSLSPCAQPPVFTSVTPSPATVRNGDTVEITAALGQANLFVTANASALDPTQTGLVILIDQGDGTYKGSVSINPWNEAADGIKQVPLTAMDFWSNTASTSVNVDLQNPAPALDPVPPNDNFAGTVIDAKKWNAQGDGAGAIRQDGKLILSVSNQAATSNAAVNSTWAFNGDFDVQVDFQIGEGWKAPAHDHLDGAALGVNIDGHTYHITRLISSNQDLFFSWSDLGSLTANAATTVTSGRYRLVRSGTTLILLYDVGSGWQELTRVDVPADPAQVYLDNASVGAAQAFTTYFSNFKINSGLTTYKP